MNANTPEPKPQPNDNPAIWALVLEDVPHVFPYPDQGRVVAALRADMHTRNEFGRAKYGIPLQAHNGRRPIVDAYQESLDLCAYIKQGEEEAETPEEKDWIHRCYLNALRITYVLKRRLMMTEGLKP